MEHISVETAKLDRSQLNDAQKQLRLKAHSTLQKISDDYSRRQTFNTAVAAVMELVNAITRFQEEADTSAGNNQAVSREALEIVLLALSPIVPHFCHVLWQKFGHQTAIIDESWPEVDEEALVQDSVQYVIQVNGKLRGKLSAAKDADQDTLMAMAKEDDNVQRFLDDKTVRKVIVVPGKLINIVVG